MKKLISVVFLVLSITCPHLFASRGLVTVCDPNKADMLFFSLIHLNYNLDEELPIEIWVSSQDVSLLAIERFTQFENVMIRKYPKECQEACLFALSKSEFDEIIWFSPDTTFVISPDQLFDDPWYRKSGAFFFRTLKPLQQKRKKVSAKQAITFVKGLRFELEPYWDYIPYDFKSKLTIKKNRFLSRYEIVFTSEALFVFNKKEMYDGLEKAIDLSLQPEFQNVVSTDLLWMGFAMVKQKIHLNFIKELGLQVSTKQVQNKEIAIAQLYKGKLLCLQDYNPVNSGEISIFDPSSRVKRSLISFEVDKVAQLNNAGNFIFKKS